MPRRPITVEDLWALPRVGSPQPAAGGSRLVVPVTAWSMETNESVTRLWLVPADGGDPRPLTSAEASSSQPALSPDGARLAFVRKPGGAKGPAPAQAGTAPGAAPVHPDQPQLYVMPLDGGEPERLTDLPLGVADPLWFPDGRRVAFLAPVLADAPTPAGTAALLKAREEDPVRVHVTEDRVYRFWDRWLVDGKVHHLFAVDLRTREIMDLTPASKRWFPLMDPAGQYRIAPDGRQIAFTACRSEPPHDPVLFGVYTVEVPETFAAGTAPGAVEHLTGWHDADAERPVYSPDGRWIVYGMQREIDFYADRVRLVAHDRSSGRHTVLTEAWDRSSEAWTFGEDPAVLFLAAETEGRRSLFRFDLEAALRDADGNPPREIARDGWLGDPRPAGGRIFLTRESLREPPEVFACAADGEGLKRLTRFTQPGMDSLALGEVEEATFEGADGRPVQMFLVHPPGGRKPAGGPRPLVHVIHGGPHGASGDAWHWRWNAQAFAAPGYLVALVNFHGSTGWGQEFAASILGRWGDQPYRDIMAATDALIARGLADPKRMAATGGSYGGYLVSWIASQTDRFACLVNHAGVCDFQTQYASDVTQGRRRSMGGEPWEDVEGMDRYNPMRHARGFRSPMLVLHGARDYRVPYNQALEVYNIYRAMGLPARLVLYPEENHWILKPRDSRHWYGEVLGWLGRWLAPER